MIGTAFSGSSEGTHRNSSPTCRVNFCPVAEIRIPITSALRCEIKQVIDRRQQIKAPFHDVPRHRWMGSVEVTDPSVTISIEHRDS